MGKAKRDIEEMPDHIYLGVTYHVNPLIMERFLKSLKRGWKSFIIPAEWLSNSTFKDLHNAGLDCSSEPCREFFGKKYYKLYKYGK